MSRWLGPPHSNTKMTDFSAAPRPSVWLPPTPATTDPGTPIAPGNPRPNVPSLTVENYVKAIYQICAESGKPAATGQIAAALAVSPGTVTSMLKTLSESNLVTYTPYEGVSLTSSGSALALRVIRRHRLIELFLVNTLQLTWDEVHEEAEHMEHAVSDRLIDQIDKYLGHPQADPHGDPIPKPDGSFGAATANRTLADCTVGEEFQVSRIVDQSPSFLRFLSGSGLPLGTAGQVIANEREAGTVTIRVEGQLTTLKGNTHPLARPQYDIGAAPLNLPMQRMLLVLKRSPEQDFALKRLVDDQQDKAQIGHTAFAEECKDRRSTNQSQKNRGVQ